MISCGLRMLPLLSLAGILLVLSACSGHDEPEPDGGVGEPEGKYMQVRISVAPDKASRANPTPGENGDGPEPGRLNEDNIHDVTIFIYDDPGKGLDADASVPVLRSFHIDASRLKVEGTTVSCVFRTDGYEPSDSHRAVTVVNAGDIRYGVNTLGKLREYTIAQIWKNSGAGVADCDKFVMATAFNGARHSGDDGRIICRHGDAGTPDNPNYMAFTSVERLAARIDLKYNSAQNAVAGNNELVYGVTAAGAVAPPGYVHVTHILPVNIMQQPSYLLKHVTENTTITGGVLICGEETTAGSAPLPSNYVIEPTTLAKNVDYSDMALAELYGNTRAANIGVMGEAAFGSSCSIGSIMESGSPGHYAGEDGYDRYVTLTYARENTQPVSLHRPEFLTGLVFRAVYEPAVVYADAVGTVDPADYSTGRTFYRYSPTHRDMSENDCLYFNNMQAAEDYSAAHPGDLAVITCFNGGICYYNLWLRHAGADGEGYDVCGTYPMEYGIVRNNIYRVGVSFSGPGNGVPDLRNPDNIRARIFVDRWNFRPQPAIVF